MSVTDGSHFEERMELQKHLERNKPRDIDGKPLPSQEAQTVIRNPETRLQQAIDERATRDVRALLLHAYAVVRPIADAADDHERLYFCQKCGPLKVELDEMLKKLG